MFLLGQHPPGNPLMFGHYRRPQRVVSGATTAPIDTDHSTAYSCVGSSKEILAVSSKFFPPARSAKRDGKHEIDPRQRKNSRIWIAAASSLSRGWRSMVFSAHSREAESDSLIACAAKKKKEVVGGEHAMMHDVALVFPPRYLSAGCSVRCCFFSDRTKYRQKYVFSG